MFVNKLEGHLQSITHNNSNEIIMGADVNADIGHHNTDKIADYKHVVGPNGLSKRNSKGEIILGMYLAQNLHVMNTYYLPKEKGPQRYGTWTNILPTNHLATELDTHMLDLLVCSAITHKQILNCHTTTDGAESDHQAVQMEVNLTSIKFKEKDETKFNEKINWRKIEEDEEDYTIYNDTLCNMVTPDMSYDDFFDATIRAGKNTALLQEEEQTGWFVLSENVLMPAIKAKN